MTGYCDIIIAIKTSNGGNYSISGVMGPDSLSFGGLSPVNAAVTLRGVRTGGNDMDPMFNDSAESLTADVWNIYVLQNILKDQKLLMFSITNNSGGIATIDTAFLRVV